MPGAPTRALQAPELLDALRDAASVLADHAAALDRLERGEQLDVDPAGPVAAGSDLAATLDSACRRAAERRDFTSLSGDLVAGATDGARGRAGRRLAEWLDGAADALRGADRLDGTRFALVLEAGAERLTRRKDALRPGCLASVSAAAADAALAAGDAGGPLAEVLVSAADAGLAELERGPQADERLSRRGAVDAAAAGFLLVLDALAAVVTGEPLPTPPPDGPAVPVVHHQFVVSGIVEPEADCGPDEALHLQSVWDELGVVERFEEGADRWRFVVRTRLPGAAVEALCEVGRPRDLSIALAEEPAEVAPAAVHS